MAANPGFILIEMILMNDPIQNMLATFQSLSQELTDEIVSYLQDDKISLLASSLTCRSLVPGCQKALFSNLCVGSPPAPSGGVIVTNIPTIQQFSKMMEMMPHVAAYTKTLKLTFDFVEEEVDECLFAQLASFRCLTHFSLHLIKCSAAYFLMPFELISSIQTILSLRTLEHLRLVDLPTDILPYDTSIKHLVIHFCDPEWMVSDTYYALRRFLEGAQPFMASSRSDEKNSTAIESLDFDHSERNIRLGINYVLDSPTLDLSRLKRLQIDIEGMEIDDQHEHISRLLQACSSIQVLRLIPSRESE